ncbi:MAG TPA: asparagine--tRNA ligase, partial [Planctomycetaceae bacterium]|nr:asparagine--tRNA ligase [Planctomycetaceae bacterium]
MVRARIASVLREGQPGQRVEVRGWVRTRRDSKQGFSFVELNDGSCLKNLQIIVDKSLPDYESLIKRVSTGASVAVEGELKESPGKGQRIELHASRLAVLGPVDPQRYPLQKKRHSFEFLREIAHLRPRTNTFGAIARVRNALCWAIHKFFQERGFIYVQTPIITTSDCEGAGQMFQVTTLNLEHLARTGRAPDYKEDFFGKKASLTVSGQLEAEIFACSLGNCYTFGPTFRAENSNTPRHLAEFWMVEPEMPFYELEDLMELAEEFIRAIVRDVIERCPEEIEFFSQWIEKGLKQRLANLIESEFARVSYTEAIEILQASGRRFEFPPQWGKDIQTEHERYLAEEHFKRPVMVYNYPRSIKPFYMKVNDDGKTVRALDVLAPRAGEIIGGSQREDR